VIYFIAGASRAGKTYMAKVLMAKLGIPLLELDYLKMGFANGLPDYGIHPLQDEETLADLLWPYLAGMIKAIVENGDDYIVEGCYVLPRHADEARTQHPGQIRACFLGYADKRPVDKLSEVRLHGGGADDNLRDRSDAEALADIERFVSFSRYLQSECSRLGFPYFEVRNRDEAVEAATRELLNGGTVEQHL
jgi:2-phosphoglycerate kinase